MIVMIIIMIKRYYVFTFVLNHEIQDAFYKLGISW